MLQAFSFHQGKLSNKVLQTTFIYFFFSFAPSDVDLNVHFHVMPLNSDPVSILKAIRKHACSNQIFPKYSVRLIPHAKVPVLMATDDNNVSMDITVQNESPSSDRTVLWIKEYPLLKTLFMVLKQVLSNYRVSSLPTFEPLSAKTAGLASYSLICMIVSYLQVRFLLCTLSSFFLFAKLMLSKLQAPKSHDPSRPEYIAETLLGFLDFYSRFDSSLYAISLIDGGAYLTADYSPIGIDPKEGKLTIIDPDVPGIVWTRRKGHMSIR